MLIMRGVLIIPAGLAGRRITRKHACGPLVIAGPLLCVPRTGISNTVVDRVKFRVVADPTPGCPATYFPGILWPRGHSQISALVTGVEGLEFRSDQHVFIRAATVRPPDQLAGLFVECGEPAAHPHFATRVADIDSTFS